MRCVLGHWVIPLALSMLLAACGMNSVTPTPLPTQTLAPTITPTPLPSSTPSPSPAPTRTSTPSPTPISFESESYKGWLTYTSATYKFAVRYPTDWTSRAVEGAQNTMSGHAVYLEPRATNLARLVVAFKRATEDRQITRTGVGSGEILQRGSVAFLGAPIRRDVLVLNGQDLAILYQGSGEIRRGDMVFALSLDYRGNPTDKRALTPEMKTTADKIVASVALIR